VPATSIVGLAGRYLIVNVIVILIVPKSHASAQVPLPVATDTPWHITFYYRNALTLLLRSNGCHVAQTIACLCQKYGHSGSPSLTRPHPTYAINASLIPLATPSREPTCNGHDMEGKAWLLLAPFAGVAGGTYAHGTAVLTCTHASARGNGQSPSHSPGARCRGQSNSPRQHHSRPLSASRYLLRT
jgi:hypothetical protein